MSPKPSRGMTRRDWLKQAGMTVLALATVPLIQGCEEHSFAPIGDIGQTGKILPFLTPTDEFYKQFGARPYIGGDWKMPEIKEADWQLTFTGEGFDSSISFPQLAQKVQEEGVVFLKTMRCVFDTNSIPGLMSNGIWRGVPLRAFLPPQAELEAKGIKRLHIFGADGFRSNVSMERVFGARPGGLLDVMLVTEMNGAPLLPAFGGPVRMMLHEAYGYKNMKWVEKIEFSTEDKPFGHYEEGKKGASGFSDTGALQVVSKPTRPLAGSIVAAGKIKVIGVAFSGTGAIEAVEVSHQGGDFAPAKIIPFDELTKDTALSALIDESFQVQNEELRPYPYRAVWVRWEFEFDAAPGDIVLRIRARDKSGKEQPNKDSDPLDGFNDVGVLPFKCVAKA